MPIHSSWTSTIQGLNNQYCKEKNDGAPAPFKCKKARQVFYAMLKKNGWDETKERPKKGTKAWDEAPDIARRYQDEPPSKCVCPDCGTTVDNPENKHCPDIKCPKCGASMRARKPGTGGGKGKGSKSAPEHSDIYNADGILDIQLLHDCLAILPYCEELSDDEYLLTLYLLMDKANSFIKVIENEQI